jgi:hypothetical protein
LLAAAAAGALVLLVPWTIYNATRFDRPVLVTTGLGTVLAGANCAPTYRAPELGSWSVRCTTRPIKGDESVVSDGLRHLGLTYARNHLDRQPAVMAARVGRTFEVYAVDPNTLGPEWVQWSMAGAWYVLAVVAVAGGVVLRRRGSTLLPMLATLVAVVITAALTWGTPRFRVPVDVVALVLAAIVIDAWLPGRSGAPPAAAAGSRTAPTATAPVSPR